MMQNYFYATNGVIGHSPLFFALMPLIMIVIIAWSMIWKGIALWKSARLEHKGWFILLLIVNTVGILEILYIYLVAREEENIKSSATIQPIQK
ncbi:MAG: DUF5652 family protein [Candidatus Paceibacterota bacterium]|jgi:methionyl-tRNA synthetase